MGLAGLSPVSALGNSTQVAAVRPLLSIPRSALAATCDANNLPYVEDPSNTDEAFDRVRIRSAALSLARQSPTEPQDGAVPTKDELARLAGFMSFVRAEQRADVDDVLARSVSVNKRWGAVEIDVDEFLKCENTDVQDQGVFIKRFLCSSLSPHCRFAVVARLLEFTASRSKPVKAPTARGMRQWLQKTHAEYSAHAGKLHSIQMGKKRVSPAERTAARDDLTKLLERKCAAGGCLAQPVQPLKPRSAKAFRVSFAHSVMHHVCIYFAVPFAVRARHDRPLARDRRQGTGFAIRLCSPRARCRQGHSHHAQWPVGIWY